MIYDNITQCMGKTPLVDLHMTRHIRLLAKIEGMNPGGSAKDRVALHMIEKAEAQGILNEDSVIIEPTSGNTGIGLAAVCAVKGYHCVIVMPENMSPERIKLMEAYGAEVILTPADQGMAGSIAEAQDLAQRCSYAWIPDQFNNPDNPEAHYLTTGPEIWADCNGDIDVFVAGIGTGGTLSGVGKYLKEKNPEIKVLGVEPEGSPLITKGYSGPHKLQGIGANFIPATLDQSIYHRVIRVSDHDAYVAARKLAHRCGILCGISGGAALCVAQQVDSTQNKGKTVVVLLPDCGDHYLSTDLFVKGDIYQ